MTPGHTTHARMDALIDAHWLDLAGVQQQLAAAA
jgi:hypothetical protein